MTLTAPPTVGTFLPPQEDMALADRIALLAEEEQRKVLDGLEPQQLLHDFAFWGRPSQLIALNSTAQFIAMLCGRGGGKTRTLAEWVHKKAMENPGCRIALVGRTVADVRDTIINGESGIMTVAPESEKPHYVPSNRTVTWPNGSIAQTFSAEKPDQLRGPQFHYGAADELAAWPTRAPGGGLANAWDNLKIATRLGEKPQIFVASTPRRVPMIIELLNKTWEEEQAGIPEEKRKYTVIRGTTYANKHLSTAYRETVVDMYEGTSLAKQELEGELLGAMDGALWAPWMIDDHRITKDADWVDPLNYPIRVVGVDPTVSDHPTDECGIIAMGSTAHRIPHKRHAYVFEDASLKGSPRKWAKEAIRMAYKYRAIIVAEDNQGGEMVRMVIQHEVAEQQRKAVEAGEQPLPDVPVRLVRSTKAKQVRAEMVVLAYEQGRVHHTDVFGMLETQMTTWEPEVSNYSPDRIDALVIAATALTIRQRGMAHRVGPPQVSKDSGFVQPHQRRLAIGPAVEDPYRPRERVSFTR